MRYGISTALVTASAVIAQPAVAQQRIAFDIDATTLDSALVSVARQAGMSVRTGNRVLRSVRTPALKGRYTVRMALRRLLRDTRYDFQITRNGVIRIIPRAARPKRNAGAGQGAAATARVTPTPVPAPPPVPIIVTATKRNSPLADYPGNAHVVSLDVAESLRFGAGGTGFLLQEIPNLTSTDLGTGRNKIFIRGVADSSFNGQMQSTISQYMDESRVTYSAPDPDLLLYDVKGIEVVEGPQGTLYGAGSLGGVVKVSPRKPEIGTREVAGTTAISSTAGSIGGEGALVANVPVGNSAAARMVVYHAYKPGYIDDIQRKKSDVNSTRIHGLRAALRVEPVDGPDLEAGVVIQSLSTKDGQYTDSGSDVLTRRSAIAQPFKSDYRLGYGTVGADLGFARLVSNTSLARQSSRSIFDASALVDEDQPLSYLDHQTVSLITHETRLSGSTGVLASWVGGLSVVHNTDELDLAFSYGPQVIESALHRSTTLDIAVFGETSIDITDNLSLLAGTRVSLVRQSDVIDFNDDPPPFGDTRTWQRVLPTAALSWSPAEKVVVYIRYREGFRPGAAQLLSDGEKFEADRFEADEIATYEVGLRYGSRTQGRFWAAFLHSYSRWDEFQADLITADGYPYVDNLGSAFLRYTSLDIGWRPADGLTLRATGFKTISELDKPNDVFEALNERTLPNVADKGFRVSAQFEKSIGEAELSLDATVGYVGDSVLALGTPLDLPQGDYVDSSVGLRIGFGHIGFSLDIDNVLNERGNRFSLGNPFTVAEGNQRTPLRPRTVRLGVDARF